MDGKRKHNSFILYTDYAQHIDLLSNEDAGRLLKAIFRFVEDGEVPELVGPVGMCFSFISANIRREKEKYEETCRKRAEAGRLGGMQKQANVANASFARQRQANVADIDTVSDIVTDNDTFINHICSLLNRGKSNAACKGRLKASSGEWTINELIKAGISKKAIVAAAEEISQTKYTGDWFEFKEMMMKGKPKGAV